MDFSQDFDDWGREKLTEARHALNLLLASPGWLIYSTFVLKQITARTDQLILNPLESLDGALAQEYAKGEVQALRLVMGIPETMIEEITSNLENLKESENDRASE